MTTPGRNNRYLSACSAGLFALCTLLLGACEKGGADPAVRTAALDTGRLVVRVTAVGTVQPLALTKVSTQLSGQVAEVSVDFNDKVEQGQVLARLDEQSFRARLNEAQAQLEVAKTQLPIQQANVERARAQLLKHRAKLAVLEAEAEGAVARERRAAGELRRVRSLAKQATVARSELDQAEMEFDSVRALRAAADAWLQVQDGEIRAARADLAIAESQLANVQASIRQREAAADEARVNLERTVIRSPLDGVVIRRDVEPGQTVAASLQAPTLFSLAGDLRAIRVEARVDEADIGRVRVDQAVQFRVDAYPERLFAGRVHKIHMAPELVHNVVSYKVLVDAPNLDSALLPGMTALVQITVEEHEGGLLLPNAALRFVPPPDWPAVPEPAPGKTWVWRVAEGGPVAVEVGLGPSDDRATLVKAGELRAGDRVVVGMDEA